MLRKILIIALLFAPFATFAQTDPPPDNGTLPKNDTLLSNLIIPDTLYSCRMDTIRIELTDSTFLQATDTSLVFEWTSSFSWHGTTTNTFFTFPNQQHVYVEGEIWLRITDTVSDYVRYDTIASQAFPFPEMRQPMQIDTVLCFGDTLVLQIDMDSVFNVRSLQWQSPVPFEITDDTATVRIVFDSARILSGSAYFEVAFFGNCTLSFWDAIQYVLRDTALVYFAKPSPQMILETDSIMCYDGGFPLTALDVNYFDVSQYEFRWILDADTVGWENAFTVPYEGQGLHVVKAWHEFCFRREIAEDVLVYDSLYFVMDSVEIRFFNRMWTNAHILITDTGVCDRVSVTLNAIVELWNQTTYHWRGPNVDTTDIHNPVRTVLPGNFTVTLRDSAGCEREFPVNVRVEDCEPSLDMPNVFTPNGDNVNDYFRAIAVNRVYNFHLRIYNRQGRMVYEFEGDPDDPSWRGWGPSTGAENAPVGTYFWTVRYNDIWGRIRREQGTVTLLR